MNTELIYCPACNHKLRVPAELMGQRVQCPKCGTEFTAPPLRPAQEGADDRFFSEPPPRTEGEANPSRSAVDDWNDPLRQQPQLAGRGVILAPAIALIVMGVFALLSGVFTLVQILTDPAGFRQQMAQIQAMMPGGGAPPPFDPIQGAKIVSGVFIGMSILQIVGGVCMASRRGYFMAFVGAVFAIVNCSNVLICIPNFAIGIWAIIVLCLPTVRAHFVRPA